MCSESDTSSVSQINMRRDTDGEESVTETTGNNVDDQENCADTVGPKNYGSVYIGSSDDLGETGDQPISLHTLKDCEIMVTSLNKDLAVLFNLCLSLGEIGDSEKLRSELRVCRFRVCAAAKRSSNALLPLLRRKREGPDDKDRLELEKLYRIYSGGMEFLEVQLKRARALQKLFPLGTDTCLLINSGMSSSFIPGKSGCGVGRDSHPFSRTRQQVGNGTEEIKILEREAADIHQLVYKLSSAIDVQPWDVREQPVNSGKNGLYSTSPVEAANSTILPQTTRVVPSRRRKILISLAVVVVIAIVLGVVIGVTFSVLETKHQR